MSQETMIYVSEGAPKWMREFSSFMLQQEKNTDSAFLVILDADHCAEVAGWSDDSATDFILAGLHLLDLGQKKIGAPGGLDALLRMLADYRTLFLDMLTQEEYEDEEEECEDDEEA